MCTHKETVSIETRNLNNLEEVCKVLQFKWNM